MTTFGWIVIGGGTGLLIGLLCGAWAGQPFVGAMFGVVMGLLIFAPMRAVS